MERWKLKTAAAAAALALLLAGCGSKNAPDPASAGSGQAAANQTADGGDNQPPDRTADMLAKIVKVNADSIVVQESKTPPSQMQGRRGFGGGQRGNRGGRQNAGGQNQSGGGQADDRQQQNGSQGTGGSGNGSGKQGSRGGRPGGFAQMEFNDEQSTIALSPDTEIIAMSFGKNGRTTTQLKASDLKAGDIVTVWLDSDKKTALYMMQRSIPANFGKAGNQQ